MAGESILAALQEPLYSGVDTYSGIGAGALAQSLPALVDPYASTGQNAAYVFGGSILAALLGNMAKEDAAEENALIAKKQADFMSATPTERLTMTQQDPRTFAKLQAALNTNAMLQEAQDESLKRQQEIMQPFEKAKEDRVFENQIRLQTDPTIRAAQIADAVNRKRGERLGEAQADTILFGDDPLKNPDSKESKIRTQAQKEEDAARSELKNLPSVASFNAASTGLAKIRALKDLDTSTSDIPFIYAFVQGQDGGVVKEGEVSMVQGANPILKKYEAQLNAALNGKSGLTPEIKRQMYEELVGAQRSLYNQALYDSKNRLEIVGQRGGNPVNASAIATDLYFPDQASQPAGLDIQSAYNALRSQGLSPDQAKAKLGIR